MPTIEDVAKQAGLSRTTVSRVINDQPYVSDEKRQCVLQAMEELGYVPNSSARRLRSQKTDTLAVLLPRITNPFFSHLIEAMEVKASKWGYQVIICQTHGSKEKELDYLELLKTKQVDGVIMTAVHNEWNVIDPYRTSGPIVLCNENVEDAKVPVVFINQEKAAYEATIHLIEQGCKQLAFLSGEEESTITKLRRRGFMEALRQRDLSYITDDSFSRAIDINSGRQIYHEIHHTYPEIDGIFSGSDEVAAGIVYEATQRGVRIPEELSIVGFDNQTISMLMNPSITTVEQPIYQMGEKCVELLIHQIEKRVSANRAEYIFPHFLNVRGSTSREDVVVL